MMRERVSRKAKERAVEHLHELTSNFYKTNQNSSTTNNDENLTTPSKRNIKAASNNKNAALNDTAGSDENNTSDYEQQSTTTTIKSVLNNSRATNGGGGGSTVKKVNKSRQQQGTVSKLKQFSDTNYVQQQQNGSSDNNFDLFSQIFQTSTSIQILVDNWIDSYKKNSEQALIDLINFLIRSCGCKGRLNKNLFKTKEYTEAISELIDYFDDETQQQQQQQQQQQTTSSGGVIDYPIINTNQQYKRFKTNFIDFIQLLIKQCQLSILYDQFMLDNLLTFLIGLSDSQIRAFRHTSTLVLVKIMTSLIDVLLTLNITKDALKRQYESEKSKKEIKRANERLETLQQKCKEFDANEYEIQNFINFIFKAVFIHRYRDVCTEIRTLCIAEIGEWMKKCPTKFLEDHFLKYIGWTLYDKQSDCRLKCIQVLQPLYESKTLIAKLELFTTRFKQRLIEMSLDKDLDVSVQTIKLLTIIIKNNESLLEDKDCEIIYELVLHLNRHVSQAAGEFLNQKLFDKVKQQQIGGGSESDGDDENDDDNETGSSVALKGGNKNKPYLLLLIQFLIESELHEHPTYLIDAMWDQHAMLKDWKCMNNLLLASSEQLDDQNERYLIEIMACCVRQASTGEYPIGRQTSSTQASSTVLLHHHHHGAGGGHKLTTKEQKQIQDDRAKMTQQFISTITPLLTKYNSDDEKLLNLLQIPLYFDLNQYKERRQEKYLDSLLDILMDIYLKSINISILNAISACLAYFNNDTYYNVYQKTMLKCSLLTDTLIMNFKQSMQLVSERSEVDVDELYPLIISLKRLASFSQHHNFLEYKNDIWSIVYNLLKAACNNESISFDIVDNCFNLIRNLVCWSLSKLNELNDDGVGGSGDTVAVASGTGNNNNNDDDDDDAATAENAGNKNEFTIFLNDCKKTTRKYYRIVNKLFVHENKQIEQEAYFELCDLLVLLNKNLSDTNSKLNSLVIECQPNDINMLLMYCINKIFDTNDASSGDDENTTLNATTSNTTTNAASDSIDKIEKLHKKRCILAAFCKLVIYNTVPMRYMAEICRGYSRYMTSYGDIIKQTLLACRDISKINTSKLISLTLQREFNELIANYQQKLQQKQQQQQKSKKRATRGKKKAEDDDDGIEGDGDGEAVVEADEEFFDTDEYCLLKELAKKFQQFIYGTTLNELNKSRDALIEFHIESIQYCNDATNIESIRFFDLLIDFTNKLNNNDKKAILQNLNNLPICNRANKNDKLWDSYFNYRDSLIAITATTAPVVSSTTTAPPPVTTTTAGAASVIDNTIANETIHNMPILSSTVLQTNTKKPLTARQQDIRLSSISKIQPSELGGGGTRKRSRTPDDEKSEDDDNDDDDSDETSTTTNTAVNSTVKTFGKALNINSSSNSLNKQDESLPTPKRTRTTRTSTAAAAAANSNNNKVSEPNEPSFIPAIS